jgi:hypothetical protein
MRRLFTASRSGRQRTSRRDTADETTRLLGADHPLTRIEATIRWLRDQAVACFAFAAVTPLLVAVNPAAGPPLLCLALLADAALWTAVLIAASIRRDRIHDLILNGSAPPLSVVEHECQHLCDPAFQRELANGLDRAVHLGQHWYQFTPAQRPPIGMQHLAAHAGTVQEVAAALRKAALSPRGVVLVERLMASGYGTGRDSDTMWLTEELGRIRHEARRAAGS